MSDIPIELTLADPHGALLLLERAARSYAMPALADYGPSEFAMTKVKARETLAEASAQLGCAPSGHPFTFRGGYFGWRCCQHLLAHHALQSKNPQAEALFGEIEAQFAANEQVSALLEIVRAQEELAAQMAELKDRGRQLQGRLRALEQRARALRGRADGR